MSLIRIRPVMLGLTVVLLSGAALGEAGKQSSLPKERQSSSSSVGTGVSSDGTSGSSEDTIDRSTSNGAAGSDSKRWQVSVGWEGHALLVANNLIGAGNESFLQYVSASISFNLTPRNDQLKLGAGFYHFALADPNENDGFRADDIVLAYDHHFALPGKFGLDARLVANAPTSFASYKMGLITAPEGVIELSRTFARYLTVDLRGVGQYFFETYTSVQGGSTPNPVGRAAAALNVEAALPWLTDLALGADFYTEYLWFYAPNGEPGAIGPSTYYGVENNPTFKVQPVQQDYGGDVYLRFSLNRLLQKTPAKGLKANVQVAYANGDPTLGYTSALVDGVASIYLFYPEASQVYVSLNLAY